MIHQKKSKGVCLNVYQGLGSEILYMSDLGTTYLDKVSIIWSEKIMAEEKVSIWEQGYTVGELIDGMEYQIVLDTEPSK